MILDSGMTQRRTDTENVRRAERASPKRRLLTAREVARLAHFLLYVDEGYTSNVVIEMNGGKFARMPWAGT
jgi:hypothetical protein